MRCGHKCAAILGATILLLVGCQPDPTPTPTPELQHIGVTPVYLEWVSDSLSSFRSSNPESSFMLDIFTIQAGLDALEGGEIDLFIGGIGSDDAYFTTPLFQDGVVIIHHPEVEIEDLTVDQLRRIFSGGAQNWEQFSADDIPISPIIPLPGDDSRLIFQRRVLGNFNYSTLARLAAGPEQIRDLVADEPGAIGIIPHSTLEDDDTIIRVEGVSPSPRALDIGQYALSYWVTAVALEEPEGPARAWIAWVQAGND